DGAGGAGNRCPRPARTTSRTPRVSRSYSGGAPARAPRRHACCSPTRRLPKPSPPMHGSSSVDGHVAAPCQLASPELGPPREPASPRNRRGACHESRFPPVDLVHPRRRAAGLRRRGAAGLRPGGGRGGGRGGVPVLRRLGAAKPGPPVAPGRQAPGRGRPAPRPGDARGGGGAVRRPERHAARPPVSLPRLLRRRLRRRAAVPAGDRLGRRRGGRPVARRGGSRPRPAGGRAARAPRTAGHGSAARARVGGVGPRRGNGARRVTPPAAELFPCPALPISLLSPVGDLRTTQEGQVMRAMRVPLAGALGLLLAACTGVKDKG